MFENEYNTNQSSVISYLIFLFYWCRNIYNYTYLNQAY